GCGDLEEPYPSLSDYHDYEPNLEFDDSEVIHAAAAVAIDDPFVGVFLPANRIDKLRALAFSSFSCRPGPKPEPS
ncbi:unnamed protein product, partial [Notodromas monacha]